VYPKFACAVRGAAGGGTGLGPPAVPSVPFSKIFQKSPSTMIFLTATLLLMAGTGPTARGGATRTNAHRTHARGPSAMTDPMFRDAMYCKPALS
jgi:hypothetical protein